MNSSVLMDFLLFDFSDAKLVMDLLVSLSWKFMACIFIAELLIARFRENSDIHAVVKRFLLIQFIIAFLPAFYNPIAKSGFSVGDEVLELKKEGIVANWRRIKRGIEAQTKQKADTSTIFFNFLTFKDTDLIRKGAALLIATVFLLLKVIYSAIFYGSYILISARALIAIFTQYSANLYGILSTIIYLILVPIIVSVVLYFLNDVLNFEPNKMGFIESLSAITSFIVLGLCLFGSLKIAKGIIDGSGLEGWGAQMGGLLSAGLGFKMLSLGTDLVKGGVTAGVTTGAGLVTGGLGAVAAPVAGGAAGMMLSPFKMGFSGAKQGISNKFQANIDKAESKRSPFYPQDNSSGVDINSPIVKGRYEREFSKIAGNSQNMTVKNALNPANHIKASFASTKEAGRAVIAKGKNTVGIPQQSHHLSMGDKLSYMGYKAINRQNAISQHFSASRSNAPKLSNQQQIQNSVIANKISKAMDSRSDKK